jgi:hypothetical protein
MVVHEVPGRPKFTRNQILKQLQIFVAAANLEQLQIFIFVKKQLQLRFPEFPNFSFPQLRNFPENQILKNSSKILFFIKSLVYYI